MKRSPVTVRTPVIVVMKNRQIGRSSVKRIFEMHKAEKKRRRYASAYSRYENDWFIKLFSEATGFNNFNDWELRRIKELRKLIAVEYNVPINYFSVFVYKTSYDFFNWFKHNRKNAIGFFENKNNLENFSYWLSERTYSWRRRRSRYPEDFGRRWGRKLKIFNQRLGIGKDEVFDGLMVKY